MKNVWWSQDRSISIYCADSSECVKNIVNEFGEWEKVDLLLSDPPYNINYKYSITYITDTGTYNICYSYKALI